MKASLLCLLLGAAVAYPQNDPVFRSSVSLVRVDAEAADAGGRVVPGWCQAKTVPFRLRAKYPIRARTF